MRARTSALNARLDTHATMVCLRSAVWEITAQEDRVLNHSARQSMATIKPNELKARIANHARQVTIATAKVELLKSAQLTPTARKKCLSPPLVRVESPPPLALTRVKIASERSL